MYDLFQDVGGKFYGGWGWTGWDGGDLLKVIFQHFGGNASGDGGGGVSLLKVMLIFNLLF